MVKTNKQKVFIINFSENTKKSFLYLCLCPVGTQRCFNVEEWLKSSCNVDQPLFNVDSTLRFQRWNPNHISTLIPRWRPNLFSTLKTSTTFLRWNNVLINELNKYFQIWNFLLIFFIKLLLMFCQFVEALIMCFTSLSVNFKICLYYLISNKIIILYYPISVSMIFFFK